uniref:Cilia- and flagella-associated protein 263 n=2 Tax=Leptocylindrus danicus TaxID=163516 RepID=A0A6U2PM28_9STRA|mmetsp:Transcript_27063/g.39963  ORF Transcript_27063/g.39963 Transcript_27063/m.39963 type:complete len:288 (+) Transcript_27063:161-1024(+)
MKSEEKHDKTPENSARGIVKGENVVSCQDLDAISDRLDSIKLERKEKMNASKQLIDTLEIIMSELEHRIEDKKKEAFDFNRDVIEGEKSAQRWIVSRIDRRDTQIEKLMHKCANLRRSKSKLAKILREKEGGNASTHYIEFHQLEIENKSIAADLQKKTKELIAIKTSALQQTSVNDLLKTTLEQLTKNKETIEQQIGTRENRLMKAGFDITKIITDMKKEEGILKDNNENIAAYACDNTECTPDLNNYIHRNAELHEVRSELQTWKRRVGTLEKVAKNPRKTSTHS